MTHFTKFSRNCEKLCEKFILGYRSEVGGHRCLPMSMFTFMAFKKLRVHVHATVLKIIRGHVHVHATASEKIRVDNHVYVMCVHGL